MGISSVPCLFDPCILRRDVYVEIRSSRIVPYDASPSPLSCTTLTQTLTLTLTLTITLTPTQTLTLTLTLAQTLALTLAQTLTLLYLFCHKMHTDLTPPYLTFLP